MWQVIAASAIGTSHLRSNLPCQDANKYRVLDNCIVVAVADGLGSASHSDKGAQTAVNSAIESLQECLKHGFPASAEVWDETLLMVFLQARRSLDELALTETLPLRDFGTTLIVVAATEQWLAVGHVGDGAVVARYDDGVIETISKPERGEYANSVSPLTANEYREHIRLSVRQCDLQNVAIVTDGLQSLSINEATGMPFHPFFLPFFDALDNPLDSQEASDQLVAFLNSDRVCAKTDDDKTLVIIGKSRPALQQTPDNAHQNLSG